MYSERRRIIFLADLDCFFVEVERLHRPELRGRAVVIGGRPGSRGVVAACSYEARALGIRSAMPMSEAYRRAGVWPDQGEMGDREKTAPAGGSIVPRPDGEWLRHRPADRRAKHGLVPTPDLSFQPLGPAGVIFLHNNLFGNYTEYSSRVQDVLRNEAPVFRAKSIDEFEMDFTGCERLLTQRFGGIVKFAYYLRQRVRETVGLPLSIGIGSSRVIAKMASRFAKPNKKGTGHREQGTGNRAQDAAGLKPCPPDNGGGGSGESYSPPAARLPRREEASRLPDRTSAAPTVPTGRMPMPPVLGIQTTDSRPRTPDSGTRILPGYGVFRVLPEEAAAFLAPQNVQAVPGIGPATSAKLRGMGINLIAQLLDQPDALLRHNFGIGMLGLVLSLRHAADAGVPDDQPVWTSEPALPQASSAATGVALGGQSVQTKGFALPETMSAFLPMYPGSSFGPSPRKPKSIGHETTFERDVADPAVWERALWRLTEDACRRLRAAGLRTHHITVKIRYSDFDTITHSGALEAATDTDSVIFARAKELLYEGKTRRLRLRLLGVRLEQLCAGASQGLLFESRQQQRERDFYTAVDRIRDKHGRDSVHVGLGVAAL
jgi:nucleotidyltransferase/DNA polymerase involved in DNA repair